MNLRKFDKDHLHLLDKMMYFLKVRGVAYNVHTIADNGFLVSWYGDSFIKNPKSHQ